MKKLFTTLAALVAIVATITAQVNYQWDPNLAATAVGGAGTWNTSTANWKTPATNSAGFVTWPTSGTTNVANLLTTAGTVTVGAPVTVNSINSGVNNEVVTGANAITFNGTPTIITKGTLEISCQVIAPSAITVSGTSTPLLNLGLAAGGAAINNDLTGGLILASTLTRLNGNVQGAFGISGKAGTITIQANNLRLSNASGSLVGANGPNDIYNNIVLPAAGNATSIGATAAGQINYRGIISGGADVYLGNNTGNKANGSGYTTLYAAATYTGATYLNGANTSYFQCGIDNCLPTTTQFLYGAPGTTSNETWGMLDLNGKILTLGSLETKASTGTNTWMGITNNNGAATASLVINGGGTSNANATFAGILGTNTIAGVLTGRNNFSLTLGSNAGALTLTNNNTFTGGLTLTGGTLHTGIANALSSSLPVTLGGGTLSTGSGAGFNQSVGALALTNNSTIHLGTGAHTITFASTGTWANGKTLTITGWTGTAGSSGTAGRIMLTTNSLTQTQLNNITFSGYSPGAQINAGELVPYSPNLTASVSLNPTAGTEVGTTTITITVTASANAVVNSTVDYTITGTGITSSDFVGSPALTGTITVLAGNSTGTATIQIADDQLFEGTETATVTLSNPTGSISTASSNAPFTIADDATFYWNGGAPTANGPANGGTGTWGTAGAWIAPVNTGTGTQQTFVDGYPAVFGGTAGTVTLDANRAAASYTFNTSGYTISTNAAGPINLNTGNITLANNVALTISPFPGSTGGRIGIGSISGSGTASVTIAGSATSTSARIDLNNAGTTINVPTTITGAAAGLAGYIATSSGAVINGNITNNSALTTMINGTGSSDITVNGTISGTAGLQISAGGSGGGGTVILTANNNYSGPTTLNATGVLKLGVNNALPTATALVIGSSNTAKLDLNGFDQTIGSASGNNGGSITNTAAGTSTNTLTINQSTSTSLGIGINDGATRKIAVVKTGAGLIKLTVPCSFTGGLSIDNGTFQLGGGNILSLTLPVTMNGGTLSTGASAGNNETTGTLNVTDNSTISFGSANHQLKFANSSAIVWTTGKTLTITNWAGTAGNSGTNGQLFVGTDNAGLTSTQLAKITFGGYNPGATILNTGEIVPASANLVADQTGFNANFGSVSVGSSSAEQSFTVSGSSLDPTVVVTPPTGFEISLTSGSGFQTTAITLNTVAGTLSTTTIYVRFTPLANTNYNNVPISVVSGPVTQNVIVSGTGTISGYYSVGSGQAAVDAIWAATPSGTGVTITSLGGFSKNVDITIQAGNTVTTSANQEIKAKNLTIQANAVLKGLTSAANATPYFMNIYGDLTVNGQLGIANGADSIAINMEGATQAVTGSGTVNIQRFRKSQNDNVVTDVTVSRNINLWWGAASIYNNFSGTSSFNITVNSGATINLEGLGDLSMDGVDGTGGNNRTGLITVNGIITGINNIYASTNNGSGGSIGIIINNGGLVSANHVLAAIGGTGTYTLSVQAGGKLDVYKSLQLLSGTFAPAGTVTLKSTSVSSIAYLDNFTANHLGTYSGQITAERFYNSSSTLNQHMIGSPINNVPLTQFGMSGGSGYIQPTADCDETQAASSSPYGTVFSLTEAKGVSGCGIAQWKVENSGNAGNGQGYSVLKNGTGTISLNGTPNLNTSYTVAGLTNSNWNNTSKQGRAMHSGWNLVANPYPASLTAAALLADNAANFDGQVQVWNANGGNAGAYTTATIIPPFQAFLVHIKNGTPSASFVINGAARTTSATAFFKDGNVTELKITATNNANGLVDATTVGFNENATKDFDSQYDADKLPGALTRHTLYTGTIERWMSVNTFRSIEETNGVPVGMEPGVNGTYTFTFDGINSFDATSYITLEDKKLNVFHDVRSGAYTFDANASDNWNRFVLHFTPAAIVATTNATCTEAGILNITQAGTANWNYTIADYSNTVISTGMLNATHGITSNLTAGVYTLTLADGKGYTIVKNIGIDGPQPVTATFVAPSTTVEENEEITLNRASVNTTENHWNFGDGSSANGVSVTHAYATQGVYTITLTSVNLTGCSSSTSQNVSVTAKSVTGIENNEENTTQIWSHGNTVNVSFVKMNEATTVTICNILGQQLVNDKLTTGNLYTKAITTIEAGYVLVKVKNGEQTLTKKVFINNK